MKKMIFLMTAACCWYVCLSAQDSIATKTAASILNRVHAVYSQSKNLSFNMLYTYTPEDSATTILDSLSGQLQLSNNRYHWSIGNTEMIADSQYVVILFKDDKIMYLTKPSQNNLPVNPIEQLDSSLLSVKGLVCTIDSQQEEKGVELNFPAGYAYKKIVFTFEQRTSMLKEIDMVVKTELLKGENTSNNEQPGMETSFVHVKARYFNYSKVNVNDSVFDMQTYFKKTDQNFSPVPAYADYKIFIGSPNL